MRPVPSPAPRAAAIIVAAGRGTRAGAPDKILLALAGRPLLCHSIEAAERATSIVDIIIVAGLHTKSRIEQIVSEHAWTKVRQVALGGERRQDSVEAGLRLVRPAIATVAVHDAARPLAPSALFDACVSAAEEHGAAIAAVPVADTLKRVSAGMVSETVSREDMWAAQTPQAFRSDLLRASFKYAHQHAIAVTDEAALFEAQGLPVAIVPSTSRNLKVTRPEDLLVAEALLRATRTGDSR